MNFDSAVWSISGVRRLVYMQGWSHVRICIVMHKLGDRSTASALFTGCEGTGSLNNVHFCYTDVQQYLSTNASSSNVQ